MNEEPSGLKTPNYSTEEMRMPQGTTVRAKEESHESIVNGPLLGILTILLIVILGGLYYWFTLLNTPPLPAIPERPTPEMNNEPESTTAEAQVEMMQALSPSDEIEAIEADLEATDLDALDAELATIEVELDAALEQQ